jgi:hypothetical protein
MGRDSQAMGPRSTPILPLSSGAPRLKRALYASQETAGETPSVAAQMERAERFGHRFRAGEPEVAPGGTTEARRRLRRGLPP